jgi:LPXTG-site transpeptidase (sortase) family protein
VLVAAGGFLLARALLPGSASPPPGAVQIPASVGTVVPSPAPQAPAVAPLAASAPVRIEIPAISVDAPVMNLGLNTNGTVQVPPLANHDLAGWYDHSVTPGQDGTSVILGHVDSYTGASVFFYLKDLRPGDRVTVIRADGGKAVFSVDGVQRVAKATFPDTVVYGNASYPALRLITCGGPFDSGTGQYLDNIVVYAHLVR